MRFSILASGSSGNCAVIESKDTKIIIDCGASISYLKNSFQEIGFDYKSADGILITHGHSDHIKQIRMFRELDVYSCFAISGVNKWYQIAPNQVFRIKDLTILPIPLSHDAESSTVGYIIYDGEETLVQMTDTGYVSDKNLALIKNANYYIFESNHDPEMLMKTNRPYLTKRRIASENGHLSNEDAANALCQCVNQDTKEIVLAHISQEANTYKLAYKTSYEALKAAGKLYDGLKLYAVEQYEIYQGGLL